MTAITVEQPRGAARRLLPRRSDLSDMRGGVRGDVVAGLTTGVVALPLALAFGVACGMGARAGLITAIVAGVVGALFGGSRVQVSGPTGAMAVVLLPIFAEFGRGGVLLAGALAGITLIAAGYLRLGRYVAFLPLPVVEGFTAGIAAVIALQQVPAALGVRDIEPGTTVVVAARAVAAYVTQPAPAALALAVGVAVLMMAGHRLAHAFPSSLAAVVVTTFAADVMHLDVVRIGHIPSALVLPALPDLPWSQLGALLPAALAIAALAGIESLLAATVADGLTGGERHHGDRELFGQGLANVVVPFFGGMPATGAIARTAVSVRAGATSRLAAVVHSVALLFVTIAFASMVGRIPLAALAGVLLVTAARMFDRRGVLALARTSRSAAGILVITLLATVLLDLVKAVEIGVAAAGILALRQVALTARLDRMQMAPDDGGPATSAHDLIDEHIVVFRIDGSLFFATAHRLISELLDVADVRVVVLRLSGLTALDTTGARMLADAVEGLEARGVVVLLSGAQPQHAGLLASFGVVERLRHENHGFTDIDTALAHARHHVTRATEHHPVDAIITG